MEVIGEAANGIETLEFILKEKPDLVLLGYHDVNYFGRISVFCHSVMLNGKKADRESADNIENGYLEIYHLWKKGDVLGGKGEMAVWIRCE